MEAAMADQRKVLFPSIEHLQSVRGRHEVKQGLCVAIPSRRQKLSSLWTPYVINEEETVDLKLDNPDWPSRTFVLQEFDIMISTINFE